MVIPSRDRVETPLRFNPWVWEAVWGETADESMGRRGSREWATEKMAVGALGRRFDSLEGLVSEKADDEVIRDLKASGL